jgi:serine phosphatase RsbU (regulator of sigma subunit)
MLDELHMGRRNRQGLEKLEVTGLLLGVRPNELYAESEFSFEIGGRLLLYTDGPLEAENARTAVWRCGAAHLYSRKTRLGNRAIRRPFAKRSARMAA